MKRTLLPCFLLAWLVALPVQATPTKNFTTLMPPEFEACGKKIGRASPEYDSLFNWFNNHTTGWYASTRDYGIEPTFKSGTMLVMFDDNKVIVKYAGAGTTGQLVRATKTGGLMRICDM